MDRKDFIQLAAPLLYRRSSFLNSNPTILNARIKKTPPYLKKGDVVGICCPSGYISLEDTQPAFNKLVEWGFEVRLGSSVGLKDFTYAGTDEQRANDLQMMLDDDSIKAILFGRGGYGAVRVIDNINFDHFHKKPKWIIGFSDATVFHSHINRNLGTATIHSKMCNSFPTNFAEAEIIQIKSIDSIRDCLIGEKIIYPILPNSYNKPGMGRGELVGGNLSIIQSLSGSDSAIDTRGKILFLEDVGEYLYSIDRMFWNLLRSGSLTNLNGLVIGNFKIKLDDPGDEFGKTIYEIILEKVKDFKYPVVFDFPVGHQKENYALKCGLKHELNVGANSASLKEM